MKIILYASSSEKERVNKESYLVELGQFDGFLRAPSSVINPVIQIQLSLTAPELIDDDGVDVVDDDEILVLGGDLRITDANYMYIPEFGRYYFISDITAHILKE